ncbi:MAG TPA: ethanolamine utilization protein EutN [Caldithrix abyssi]|uniref:Ethanolamine utilization protein EutN n=1 Tax=Caldithrix abyssi TaxID=187145 RepID=A0A7V5PQP7_CALAY|nr:ethanolamine utilization protein EutN [Caldithrix abyssi]
MNLARVIGTIWATRKDENLEGLKMQLLQPVDEHGRDDGQPFVAVDTVGAGQGELVYYVTAYEAVIPLEKKPALADATIVGIVDRIELN